MDIQDISPPAVPHQDNGNGFVPPLKPNTWLWQSIAVTLCCFPILGIVALVNGIRVNSLYYAGFYEKAEQASKRAKMWALIGLIAGIVYSIAMTIMMLKGNYFEEINNILYDDGHSIYNY